MEGGAISCWLSRFRATLSPTKWARSPTPQSLMRVRSRPAARGLAPRSARLTWPTILSTVNRPARRSCWANK
eukprot:12030083-Alexandrium_andersonii.AAC.1